MAGAQFIGKEKLFSAFERWGGGTWQLAQGKKVCATGEGAAELEEWIDFFAPAGSRSPYTLHLYRDIGPDDITASTKPSVSWDFTMSDNRDAGAGSVAGTAGVVGKLQKKIDDRIAEKLGALIDQDDEEDSPSGNIDLIAIINDYAQNPHKLGQVIGAVNGLMGMLKNTFGGAGTAAQPAVAAIGSVTGNKPQAVPPASAPSGQYPDGTYERLCAVLNKLEQRDPKLIEHLEKMAGLDDITFSIILSKLDAL